MSKYSIFFVLLWLAIPGYADVYKCKDPKGNITYSDTACSDTKSEKLGIESDQSTWQSIYEKLTSFFSVKNNSSSHTQSTETVSNQSAAFQCSGKQYCSEMTSCEEATFYLNNCPSTKMDGDGDGIPCEQQWC